MNELRDALTALSDPLYATELAEAAVEDAAVKLTEALAESNGEIGTQTEASRDALEAIAGYADKVDDFAGELVGLPMDEVNQKFQDQRDFIQELADTGQINNERVAELNGLLDTAFDSIAEINAAEMLLELDVQIDDSTLALMTQFSSMGAENFGQQFGNFLGYDSAAAQGQADQAKNFEDFYIPFANGGIVTKPTFPILAGEQGPEAIIPLNQAGNMLGGGTTVNVIVQGSVLSEMDLSDAIQAQLIRTKNRNASLEFG